MDQLVISGPSHNWDSYPCIRAKTQTVLPDTPSSPVAYAVFSLHKMSTSYIVNNLAGEVGFEPTVHAFKVRCLTTWPLPKTLFTSALRLGFEPSLLPKGITQGVLWIQASRLAPTIVHVKTE